MIHEGPLLEYGGRDLAYLQWAAAARHWLVLVLAAQVFLPHPAELVVAARRCCRSSLVALCAALALHRDARREDADAARPAAARGRRGGRAARHRRLAGGVAVSGALAWALVALGLAVVVVRRRSVAVALVTAQALVLAGVGAARARRRRASSSAAVRARRARRSRSRRCSCLLVARTREPRPVRAGAAPLAARRLRGRRSRWP